MSLFLLLSNSPSSAIHLFIVRILKKFTSKTKDSNFHHLWHHERKGKYNQAFNIVLLSRLLHLNISCSPATCPQTLPDVSPHCISRLVCPSVKFPTKRWAHIVFSYSRDRLFLIWEHHYDRCMYYRIIYQYIYNICYARSFSMYIISKC